MLKKFTVTALFLFATSIFNSQTQADVIAGFTFETSVPTTAGPHNAEVGTGTATGLHASGSTVYSNPQGNGSTESFSSNFWAAGDYYQFVTSTVGFSDIVFSWDQTGSNTGPRDFQLQYNVGAGFVTAQSYSITNDAWTGTYNPISTRSFDFSAITAMNNNPIVTFRLTMVGTTAITGGTVATGGTGRVDNVLIQNIPEPSSILALTFLLSGTCLVRRRS